MAISIPTLNGELEVELPCKVEDVLDLVKLGCPELTWPEHAGWLATLEAKLVRLNEMAS
jgi:hypothetical protein